jgi:hypothetical protein
MYTPFSGAMNYALQRLSKVDVDGLPAFRNHIAFVPCREREIQSNRAEPGSLFKPDLAIMSLEDAYKFYEPGRGDGPELSEFTNVIAEKKPSGPISWSTVLSVIEIKRSDAKWAPLGVPFKVLDDQGRQNNPPKNVNVQLNGEQDNSRSTTRKIDLHWQEFTLTPVGQRFHRRLWFHPSGLQILRGWNQALGARATSDSADGVPLNSLRINIPLKTGYTLQRNSLIRFPSATWSIYLFAVSL